MESLKPIGRLLEAVAEINDSMIHSSFASDCRSCRLFDELQAAAMAVSEENDALRAELERERARLNWALSSLVTPSNEYQRPWLTIAVYDDLSTDCTEIHAGQTARDVIDRMIEG